MRCKKAQFFLLAAILISAVVISMGITANRADVTPEPRRFSDFSYEVKNEMGRVIDYEIYTSDYGNLDGFVDLAAVDVRDKNPDANFLFVYGDSGGVTFKNFGAAGGVFPIESKINIGSGFSPVMWIDDAASNSRMFVSDPGDVVVEFMAVVRGHEFKFPITDHRQAIFVIQKDVGDESFVEVR